MQDNKKKVISNTEYDETNDPFGFALGINQDCAEYFNLYENDITNLKQ